MENKTSDIKLVQTDEAIEEQALNWLARLDSSDTTERDWADFSKWLDASPQHKTMYEEVKRDWRRFDVLSELDKTAKQALDEELLPETTHSISTRYPNLQTLAAMAAVLFIAIIGLGGTEYFHSPANIYQTDVGAQKTVTLEDGSSIKLNTDTKIEVDFLSDERRLTLISGEAYFDVAHDPARPFKVKVLNRQVQAIGTAFNIYRKKDEFSVLVTDGTVKVSESQDSATGNVPSPRASSYEAIVVTKGEKIRVNKDASAAVRVVAPSVDKDLSWQNGELEFSGETLEGVVQQFSRYTDKKIFLMGDDIRYLKVGGVFEAGNVEALVSALDVMLPIKVTRMTPYVTLLAYEG
ncbi:MAG: FecR domain-containing protein [Kordiimonas sp.]